MQFTIRSHFINISINSKQLVNKLFHICDTTLAAAGVDVSQGQFLNESKLQVQVEDIVFNLEVHNLLMSKKPLKVYAEPLEMEQILANPLPDIYPLSPSLGIFESNIYRPEQLFRKSDRSCMCIDDHGNPTVFLLPFQL